MYLVDSHLSEESLAEELTLSTRMSGIVFAISKAKSFVDGSLAFDPALAKGRLEFGELLLLPPPPTPES